MAQIKNIAVLGSTGSIGTQTLDIISDYPEYFHAYLLVAGNNVDLLIEQCRKFNPEYAIIANESLYQKLLDGLRGTSTKPMCGSQSICDIMSDSNIHLVVTAMVGYAGLEPTINALKHGKCIALANKETLVAAGELIMTLARYRGVNIYPVDSEHSAIFQSIIGEEHAAINKLILTASGGPFRTFTKEQMLHVGLKETLKHPNWNMGAKITVDSATMMNKGFEIIEARWLFGIEADRIEVAVHPQSIVHSMVEFVDGAIKAQLGVPDMHLPIQFALGYPRRLTSNRPKLSIMDYSNLTFEKPDTDKFPLLAMTYTVIERGGNTPCAMNAANEIAVAAFLKEKIKYVDIAKIIEKTLEKSPYIQSPNYDDIVTTNIEVRNIATEIAKKYMN